MAVKSILAGPDGSIGKINGGGGNNQKKKSILAGPDGSIGKISDETLVKDYIQNYAKPGDIMPDLAAQFRKGIHGNTTVQNTNYQAPSSQIPAKNYVPQVYLDAIQRKRYEGLGLDTLEDNTTKAADTYKSVIGGWQDKATMDKAKPVIENTYNKLKNCRTYLEDYGGDTTEISKQIKAYKEVLDGWDELVSDYGKYASADEAELEVIRKRRSKQYTEMETARRSWEEWKDSEGTVLSKVFDYIGGSEVNDLRRDYEDKKAAYERTEEEYSLKKQELAEKRIQQTRGITGAEYINLLKERKNAAETDSEKEYYKKELKNVRKELYGESNVFKHVGNIVKEGLLQVNKGVMAATDFLLGTPAKWLGFEDNGFTQANRVATEWADNANVDTQKSAQYLGDTNNISGQLGVPLIAAVPDFLLTIYTGGASKSVQLGSKAISAANPTLVSRITTDIAQTAKSPIFYTSFIRELGINYEQNLESGEANEVEATLAALFASAVTARMEMGGFQELPSELAETKGFWKKAYKWAISSFEEGLEEPGQTSATNLVNKIIYDHDKKLVSTTDDGAVFNLKRAAKEFAIGTFVGAALGGGQLTFSGIANARSNSKYKQIGKAATKTTNIQEIIDYAKSAPNDSIRTIAREVNANNITDADAGRVYQYVVRNIGEKFNDVYTVDELNAVVNEYFLGNTPKAIRDIASATFANKLVEMNIQPESNEVYNDLINSTNTTLTEEETQLLNTPDAELTVEQRAEKQSIIERQQSVNNPSLGAEAESNNSPQTENPLQADADNGIINNVDNASIESRFSPEEKQAAILDYKSGTAYRINGLLREGAKLDNSEQEFVNTLDEALRELPTYEGEVYRNLTFDDIGGQEAFDAFLEQHSVDKLVYYNQFTSCSTKADGYPVEGDYRVHMVVDGKSARDVDGYGNNMESEVIFTIGSAFLVTKVDTNGQYPIIHLQEVVTNEQQISLERGNAVRDVQELHTENGDLQSVSERDTTRNSIGSVRPQSAASGRQGNNVRARGGQDTLLPAESQKSVENEADPEGPANFMPESGGSESRESGRADGDIVTFGNIDTDKGRHLDKAQQDEIKAIGEKLGRKVDFEDFYTLDKFKGKKKIPDGYIDKDGTVHINYYAKRPVHFLLKHEITHYLKRSLKSYVDFMTMVFKSEAFEDWLNKKGHTLTSLKAEKMDIYSEVENFNEERCLDEILADFVGEYLFGGEYAVSQKLINALKPKQKKTFRDVIKSIIDYFKKKFSKNKTLLTEIEQIEKEFIKVYKEAVEVKTDEAAEESYSFTGYAEDGRGKYKSNFPKGTPKMAKADKILNYIQNVWSKKPIKLKIEENGNIKYIEAKFDPTYDESGNIPTDASKLMGGNRHGTSSEQRVTLDLADDYYQIASESQYNYSKDETGKDNPAHKDVTKWHYFINDIYFAEYDSDNYEPYRVSINVKERADGEYVYSFSAEKQRESDTPRTLHAVVNERENPDANVELSNNKVTQSEPIVKNNISKDGDFYSIPGSTTDRKSILTDLANGEITVEEAEKLLSSKKTLNPAEIANLSKKDADTTASEHKRQQGENNGDGESKFYDSLMKSDIFDLQFKDEIKDDSFIKKYKTITNKETLKTAAKELDEGGRDYVERWWGITPERASVVDTAVGFILMDRYQRAGKYEQAVAVAERVRAFGTAGGQQVQIFSIIGRFNPDMMVAYAQHELSKAYETMIDGKAKKWIDNNKDKFKLTDKEIEFIRLHTIQAAMFEEGSRGRAIALGEICKIVQDKIPTEKGDNFKAFQRICMLLNPKTNLRNINGNAGMVGVFIASDFFGSGIDKLVSKKTGVRTTGNFDIKSVKGFKKGLYETLEDFKRGIHTKQEELNRFDVNSKSGKNFNEHGNGLFGKGALKKQLNDCAKFLNKLDNFTSFCLEVGDRPFFEMWYMNALNNQLKLNNTDVPTVEMMELAKEEALKRTWQDDNMFTRAAAKVRDAFNIVHFPNSTYGLGDFVYKFIKTPTNIAKAIVEFSPMGFAGAAANAKKLKNAIETNQFKPQMQKEYVRSLSNAITGTLLYTLVAVGAGLGLVKLSGDGDDDKDVGNYEKYILGIPPYSIEFLGVNISYDWMQPFGSILAVVAEFMESREDDSQGSVAGDVLVAIKAGGKIFAQQSFLQGLYDLCSSEDWIEGLSSIALAEPSVYIPQALSQTASFFDPYRRNSYDASNGFKNAVNKMIAKIPGLRNTLAKQKNTLGEDVENPQFLNPWLSFASPWNTYPKSSSEVVEDIYKLYKESGDKSVMPRVAPNYVDVKENRITFSPQQKANFQKMMGDQSVQMLTELFNSNQYSTLSDQQKVKVVGRIYSYSYAKAKAELKFDYQTLSAMVGKYKNGQPILTEAEYERLPQEARKMLAQEYFLSKTEIRYLNDDKGLVEYYINQSKQ